MRSSEAGPPPPLRICCSWSWIDMMWDLEEQCFAISALCCYKKAVDLIVECLSNTFHFFSTKANKAVKDIPHTSHCLLPTASIHPFKELVIEKRNHRHHHGVFLA
jgi:hypothetical protein